MRDSASSFEYPNPTSTVLKIPPNANILIPEAPVKVVNIVITKTVAMTTPPLKCPIVLLTKSKKRFPALPLESMYPAIVKRGIAAIPPPLFVRM